MLKLFILLMELFAAAMCVPPQRQNVCLFSQVWRDEWYQPKTKFPIGITSDSFGPAKCATFVGEVQGEQTYILNEFGISYSCLRIEQLHFNVLRFKLFPSMKEKEVDRLCYSESPREHGHLYRKVAQQVDCPDVLSGSHSFMYSEFSPTTQTYTQNCGDPTSEMNKCNQRTREDPQLSLTYGNCPEGTLYHRTSMTQNLRCIGRWKDSGKPGAKQYFITLGETWEYWEPGDYRSSENEYRCWALDTDGLKVYLSQAFGTECDGVGGLLTLKNGLRNLVLEKKLMLDSMCEFPDWAVKPGTWQVIPQTGLQLGNTNATREVVFLTNSTFKLSLDGIAVGQTFSCAKVLQSSSHEVMLQTFSRSQCFGEYHCFHATLDSDTGLVNLHVGAPSANIEHSCVAPSFDPDVPFLMATLVPLGSTSKATGTRQQTAYAGHRRESRPSPSFDFQASNSKVIYVPSHHSDSAHLDAIQRDTLARLTNKVQEFSQQISALFVGMIQKIKDYHH